MTGEVCSDDDKISQVGFQRRPNYQICTVGRPQNEIPSFSGGAGLRLAPILRLSGKCRIDHLDELKGGGA